MNPDPPLLLSYWPASAGCAGITATQQVTARVAALSPSQFPSGVASRPMFSLRHVEVGVRLSRLTA